MLQEMNRSARSPSDPRTIWLRRLKNTRPEVPSGNLPLPRVSDLPVFSASLPSLFCGSAGCFEPENARGKGDLRALSGRECHPGEMNDFRRRALNPPEAWLME